MCVLEERRVRLEYRLVWPNHLSSYKRLQSVHVGSLIFDEEHDILAQIICDWLDSINNLVLEHKYEDEYDGNHYQSNGRPSYCEDSKST